MKRPLHSQLLANSILYRSTNKWKDVTCSYKPCLNIAGLSLAKGYLCSLTFHEKHLLQPALRVTGYSSHKIKPSFLQCVSGDSKNTALKLHLLIPRLDLTPQLNQGYKQSHEGKHCDPNNSGTVSETGQK